MVVPKGLLGAPRRRFVNNLGAAEGHNRCLRPPFLLAEAPAEALADRPRTHVSGLKSRGWVRAWGSARLPAPGWVKVDKGGQPSRWEAEPGSLALAPLPATSERDLQRPRDEASRLSSPKILERHCKKSDIPLSIKHVTIAVAILVSLIKLHRASR